MEATAPVSYASRLRGYARHWKWTLKEYLRWVRGNAWPYFLIYSGLNNLVINCTLLPVKAEDLRSVDGLRFDRVDISRAEYDILLAQRSLEAFRRYRFEHSKVLEYAASRKLLNLDARSVLLDAAGGSGEYLEAIRDIVGCNALYCNDLLQPEKVKNGIHFIGKSVTEIDLPDGSLSAVACHHSIEHFQGDGDMGFIDEIVRLLRPGGKACILPLFLARPYVEIWNTCRKSKFDEQATTVNDPFATFTGWGNFEGFARVYDIESFKRRLLSRIPANFTTSLVEVTFEGKACPQIGFFSNRHQPPINRAMRAFVIERIQ